MRNFTDFDTIVKNMGDLPPSPIVAQKILDLLRDPDLRIKDLANAVSLDPAISARLLRMANSAFYDQQKQINSVDRAIIVIGEDVLKNLAMECSLRGAHKTYGLLERRLWEGSIGSAVACRMIAGRITDIDPSEAYLCGLQHHIGKVVMVNRDKDLYKEVMRIADSGLGSLRDVERGLFAYSHELVGAALLDYWDYPKVIVKATLHHHEFESLREKDPEAFTLCAVLAMASDFCRFYGIGCAGSDDETDLSMNRGTLALEANMMVVDEMLDKFYSEFVKERTLFLS
ncbi:HD-like signal output (HDOD) domain, no enzymatic activity [Malonomonas rubra DSM 5091]|uniref:HD-like signal output (HDOD) domain, no enzymatic activity n=1 Tax=Malonomonas rubra DSM 5091 TaxID=1122189 RepID=A0A1M6FJW3_MALRU|nr:HDOD domain-containing protein [Malonomonas rubra]SHI97965.1 HD-like signal output (HDOD) domain, no enzymatic activity [Malonomonas rubra DSM 5091]